MRRICLFSGGYDSTLLLANIVEECNKNPDEEEVLAITIKNNLTGEAKNRREESAQILILHELRNRFPKVKIEHEVIKIESEWKMFVGNPNRGLAQPLLWMTNVLPLIHEGDMVYMGYLKDDDVGAYIPHIKEFWNSALQIQDGKKVELVLPYKTYNKPTVLKCLLNDFDYLFDLCTSCEGLGYHSSEVCGMCIPCEHLKSALIQLCVNTNSSIRQKAMIVLKDKFGFTINVTHIAEECKEEENYVSDKVDCS